MVTAHEYGLETTDERLTRINITKTLCLGTKLNMTARSILEKMSDAQIKKMFDENLDVQYILLDSQGYEHSDWMEDTIR